MATTITKQECLDLIDSLADKSLTKGCKIEAAPYTLPLEILRPFGENKFLAYPLESDYALQVREVEFDKVLGHDVTLGRLLRTLREQSYDIILDEDRRTLVLKLTKLFEMAGGEDKSLQSIFKDLEWEDLSLMDFSEADTYKYREPILIAKPSPATDLFVFLRNLQLKN